MICVCWLVLSLLLNLMFVDDCRFELCCLVVIVSVSGVVCFDFGGWLVYFVWCECICFVVLT